MKKSDREKLTQCHGTSANTCEEDESSLGSGYCAECRKINAKEEKLQSRLDEIQQKIDVLRKKRRILERTRDKYRSHDARIY